ncbi:MAG TPA: hypothetical protein VMU83_21105 [Hanamia sp.]|nr:hypothetical protein [Hanamia sp.]
MKIKLLHLSFVIAIFLGGCTTEQTTVQIVRNPLVTFTFNGNSSWKANNYSFAPVSKVVVYPQDTTQPGQLYNRLTLQATGTDSLNNTYQFILTFDAVDMNQLTGVYSPLYSSMRGIDNVQLFNLTNSSDLSAYALYKNSANAVLQIQKQDIDETLITGTFQMTLYNTRDTTQKIKITNGILRDITY